MLHRLISSLAVNTKHAQRLVLGLIAAIAVLIVVKLWPAIFGGDSAAGSGYHVETLPPLICDPGIQTCSRALPGGGRLDFKASPGPIRPLRMLQLTVTLADATADRVDIAFEGTQMAMGMARVALARESGDGGGNRFRGEAMLPVCVTGAMEWSATVLLTRGRQAYAIPFHFEVAAR